MQDDEQTFSLRPWRGQWAHLPLVILPFALMMPLTLLAIWLQQTRGLERLETTLGWVASLGFAVLVFALPVLWMRQQKRGTVLLRVTRGRAELLTPAGQSLAVTPVTPGNVRFGVFKYTISSRIVLGTFRSPRVEIVFPERRLVIGGESVPAGDEEPLEAKPGFLVTAAEWARLVSALGG